MRTPQRLIRLALAGWLISAAGLRAVTFTSDTAIAPFDTNYDGTDIVISNCTLTVDGAHTFASLLVGTGGTLTHTFSFNGLLYVPYTVTNESQVLNGTTPVTLAQSNVVGLVTVTDSGQTTVYSNGVDYLQLYVPGGAELIQRTPGSAIPDGATVLVTYTWDYLLSAGLSLSVTGDVEVASGGSINANSIGYGAGQGPGGGFSSIGLYSDGSGGGHGGGGGKSAGGAPGGGGNDRFFQPTALGSGGGASYAGGGGNGGGSIQIAATGNVQIDGVISADGAAATNDRAGGGAGGSIYISAANVGGSGSVSAIGGAGAPLHGGGGGGGCIAIQCGTNNFAGSLTADGGSGWQAGGAGTIYTQITGQNGSLLVDNRGQAGAGTPVALPTTTDLTIQGMASVIGSSPFNAGNLTIATNSTLTGQPQTALAISVAGTMAIQGGGVVLFDGLGYAAGNGPGAGHFNSGNNYVPCTGGGHGGYGAVASVTNAAGGQTYDSQTGPTTVGSGGGTQGTSIGGSGGGAVRLIVSGNLQVDGRITANGVNGSGTGGGGGSGGSIYISALTMGGAGAIAASGGNGAATVGGGGGGGRIAILTVGINSFAGSLGCAGGGANWGGAGTIYLQSEVSPGPVLTELLLDNGGNTGPATPLQSASSANLVLQNGASGTASSPVTFANLLVASNAWLTAFTVGGSESFSINGNATFQAGGGFIADSGGYGGGQGSGAGHGTATFPYSAGGGGHGGNGGNSLSNLLSGGMAYDSIALPSASYPASGGGGYPAYSYGGSGGGFINFQVTGLMELDGIISANGGNGAGIGGGGGAGGGIVLHVGTLAGGGAIAANGGNGANFIGGGGGGGRVAVYFTTNSFAGAISAFGGGGANYGGAGTIYVYTNHTGHAQLVVDNARHSGAGSPIQTTFSSSTDLTLRNNSLAYVSVSPSFGNVFIGSNSWLVATSSASGPASVSFSTANVTIQSGGGLIADGTGYAANQGIGHGNYSTGGSFYPCSGGGHEGYGANSFSNSATGGWVADYYDSITQPRNPGSGGGGYLPFSVGGNGGGFIQLSVAGTLRVDGVLSANGLNGTGSGGGGGSGGSVILSVNSLLGSGVISANGGSGAASLGGGGGGGMITLTFTGSPLLTSNLFSGALSAFGGGGANYGGAGTIYLHTNYLGPALLIVDNAGHPGTNTFLSAVPSSTSLILRNGAVAVQSSPQILSSLFITSNAWFIGDTLYPVVNLTVNGNATLQAGGGIVTDTAGNAQNTGSGRGLYYASSPLSLCTGGGHGGYGGLAISNGVPGGVTYDSTTLPSQSGSGGGGYFPYAVGGNGGGEVSLSVGGILELDGIISANGGNGSGSGGGGSGGSIYLIAGSQGGSFAGSGGITANGGNGALIYGGGGGGGRIAIYSSGVRTNSFAGVVTAYGGGGANYGGAGTVYYGPWSTNFAWLLLDNANHAGTNTSFDPVNSDVTVQNGAVGFLPTKGTWFVRNILVRTNGMLRDATSSLQCYISASNVRIDAGGAITLDGAGYGSLSGPGGGGYSYNLNGGGGHGGYGGGNIALGGRVYDSIQAPTVSGSGGAPSGYGGRGGGAFQLTALSLIVNGTLSANGTTGTLQSSGGSGGGSGGSLFLENVFTLAGNGVISANGGPAIGSGAGGGGGGRIAILCTSNNFTGHLTAGGGNGTYPGGAGTVFTSLPGVRTLLVDNSGLMGANTPLSGDYSLPTVPFDLDISGGAAVVPLTPLPILSNLNLATNSTLTLPIARTNLYIAILNNASLAGNLNVDYLGFPQTNGPGAGVSIASKGSGGGYGGIGGASSSGAPGGTNYGSATQPVDFGSGGGAGEATATGGSEGGGAVRVSVAGNLNVSGNVSANGDAGLEDDSGGGSGGSIWITAGTLTGAGNISALGGAGVLFGGGGGGGGRIAIYAPTNNFGGTTNVIGGAGASPGQPGTIFLSSVLPNFQIVSQSPTGLVLNTVSYVDLSFSEAVAPASLSASTFTLNTPEGMLDPSSISAAATSLTTVRVSFPTQNVPGDYSLQAPTSLASIFGVSLGQPYAGGFTISVPTISGQVTDTNGAPVAGVLLQPDGGLIGSTTDTNGDYSVGVPPGWYGTITPSFGSEMFVPASLTYTNVTASLTGQNYLMVPTVAPTIGPSLGGSNLSLNWAGIPGVSYQLWWSTNLVDWQALGNPVIGTNGPMQIAVPLGLNPDAFFRVGATP